MKKIFPYLTRPILVLSIVSLFTDMASEMLYPVMPVYLKTIGFSVLLIGILEGLVEMIAGLSKGYFGQLSDVQQKRLPFVRIGYALSAISKPMLAVFKFPAWIFFSRSVDRFGKGIRTAPRDALLSSMAENKNKGAVFGFHRSMDTLGAVIGPLIALIYLGMFPGQYKTLFLIAFAPGIMAVLFTFLIKEKKQSINPKKIHFFSFVKYGFGENSGKSYKQLLTGLLIFALINSSDVLLLLKMKDAGISDQALIIVYIFYNLAFALLSFPAGLIADKMGLNNVFIFGLILFAIVYGGFAIAGELYQFWILFFIYGFYAACTEGISKAWITRLVPQNESATAIGTYTAFASIGSLIASSLAGFLWYKLGAAYAFGFTSVVAAILVFYFLSIRGSTANLRAEN